MRYSLILLLTLAGPVLAGCGSPTAAGSGRVEAVIQDTPSGTPTVTGTMQGNIFASLSPDGNTWADLGSPNGITIALQSAGTSTTVHGEEDAPAGGYSLVRLVFSGVTVRVLSGSTVGGVILNGDATLDLGGTDNQVEVEIVVPVFTVDTDPGVRRTIIFDLRSHLWLTAAALQAGRVEDAAFQAAVTAATREDPR